MSKESYKNKMDSIKRDIARKRAEITSWNDKIKDCQTKKKQQREYYSKLIKAARDSSSKASHRSTMNSSLKSIDYSIASYRSNIANIKRGIESLQTALKNTQEAYKKAK